jgi:hypothetical protein
MFGKYNLAAKVIEAGGKLTVRSALNPVLWLCAIITIPGLVAIQFMKPPPLWLIALICSPVGAAIFGFLVLLFFDRDKLQSEEYQLRKRSLELMEEKGDKGPVPIESEYEVIEDPQGNKLAHKNQGGPT